MGQLKFLYTSINNNIYKQGFATVDRFGIVSNDDITLNQYSGKDFANVALNIRKTIIGTKESSGTPNNLCYKICKLL